MVRQKQKTSNACQKKIEEVKGGEKEMIKIKKEKGITLVALIITIIILVILAAVSIRAAYNSGIVEYAVNGTGNYVDGSTKESSSISEVEGLMQSVMDELEELGKIKVSSISFENAASLPAELEVGKTLTINAIVMPEDATDKTVTWTSSNEAIATVSQEGVVTGVSVGNVTITASAGKKSTIYELEIIPHVPKITIGGTNITVGASVESLVSNYGDTVDSTFFSSVEGVSWQLFYDDANYVFLIASDYVENSKLPCDGNTIGGVEYTSTTGLTKSTESGYTTYCAKFGNELIGTAPYSSGSVADAITNNPLSSTYLKWAAEYSSANYSNLNKNICAVAFMMDTSKWSSFAGNTYTGAFAIGGPTIELFVKSWNSKHTEEADKLGEYDTITKTGTDANVNSWGYKVKKGTGSWETTISSSGALGTTDSMWLKTSNIQTSNSRHDGYWLAAPCPQNDRNDIYYVQYHGILMSKSFLNGYEGFRPLVCIPKTSI